MLRPPLDPLSLSIVLPCHDEEPNVARVVRAAVGVGRRVAADLEVIVVDDGSRDATGEVARAVARELPEVRVVTNATCRGYGGALARGFRAAQKTWVFYTDGDGQFDLEELPAAIALLARHDVVSGYRAHRQDGAVRGVNGRLWTALTNATLGLGLRDVNCAFKIYPRALFDRIDMTSTGALIDAEVLFRARQLGLSIGQTAVRHLPRQAGRQTGGDPRVIGRALLELARLVTSDPARPLAVDHVPAE